MSDKLTVHLGKAEGLVVSENGATANFWIPLVAREEAAGAEWLRLFNKRLRVWPQDLPLPQPDERGEARIFCTSVPLARLEDYTATLKRYLDETNDLFSREVEPYLLREREEQEKREAEAPARETTVKRRLDELL